MEPMEILAQIIGLGGMAMNILSYQGRSKQTVILMQLFGTLLFTFNMAMLGAITGALMNGIGFVRAIVFYNKEKFHADHIAWMFGFIAAFALMYPVTFLMFDKEPTALNLITELLPIIGMCAATVGYHRKEARHVRALGLISAPCWLTYNLFNGSIGGLLCEVFALLSILIGMLRYDRKTPPAA